MRGATGEEPEEAIRMMPKVATPTVENRSTTVDLLMADYEMQKEKDLNLVPEKPETTSTTQNRMLLRRELRLGPAASRIQKSQRKK